MMKTPAIASQPSAHPDRDQGHSLDSLAAAIEQAAKIHRFGMPAFPALAASLSDDDWTTAFNLLAETAANHRRVKSLQ